MPVSPAPSASEPAVVEDARDSARAAGLRYVVDRGPAITRRPVREKGFEYLDRSGEVIKDEKTLARIRALAIPPAWTDVWICPSPNGHIQATGRDAKGRKQYRYHNRWREVRDELKFDRMIQFGEALPRMREAADHDLRLRGITYRKVLAAIVSLLGETSIRIGNEEYRRANESFGLTTLQDDHVQVEGSSVRFEFRGKSGKEHSVKFSDRRLAKIIKACRDIPGQELFQYFDDNGERRVISSDDVNEYIKEISSGDFTAKDFRTWNGTVFASRYLTNCEPPTSATEGKKQVVQAIKEVSARLGNTPAVCRKSYVHPAVVNAYLEGTLQPNAGFGPEDAYNDSPYALSPDEQRLLDLLRTLTRADDLTATAA